MFLASHSPKTPHRRPSMLQLAVLAAVCACLWASTAQAQTVWSFDGTMTFAATSDQRLETIALPNGSFHIRFEIRMDRTATQRSTWHSILHKGATDRERTPGLWLPPEDDRLHFALSTNRTFNHHGKAAVSLPQGQWTEVIYSHDATRRAVTLFIDGAIAAHLPYEGDAVYNTGPFHFGRGPHYPSFVGGLRQIRVEDGPATAQLPANFSFTEDFKATVPAGSLAFAGQPYAGAEVRGGSLAIPNRDAGMKVPGLPANTSSTLRFKMRLSENSTGGFRSIAHKGATNEQRTPGLWLDRESRHLLFASSTATQWNAFGRSRTELPMCDWVDVAVTVDDPTRRLRLYLDGALDSELALPSQVQANGADFYFGRSPWHLAARGEIDDLEIHDRALSAAEIASGTTAPDEPAPQLDTTYRQKSGITPQNAQSYAVYYGPETLDGVSVLPQLSQYDLVILEPDNYTADEITRLRDTGTVVIGYLSFGEQTPAQRTAAQNAAGVTVDWDWANGQTFRNSQWGSYYVRPTAAWNRYVTQTLMPEVLTTKGCDGIFMDTLDTADLHNLAAFDDQNLGLSQSQLRQAFVGLVTAADAATTGYLIANRGFSLSDDVAASLDAVVFESFSQQSMLDDSEDWLAQGNDYVWTEDRLDDLQALQSRTGVDFAIWALDYACPFDTGRIGLFRNRANSNSMPTFLSTQDLKRLPGL